jgi:hypothetical protein
MDPYPGPDNNNDNASHCYQLLCLEKPTIVGPSRHRSCWMTGDASTSICSWDGPLSWSDTVNTHAGSSLTATTTSDNDMHRFLKQASMPDSSTGELLSRVLATTVTTHPHPHIHHPLTSHTPCTLVRGMVTPISHHTSSPCEPEGEPSLATV